MIRKIIFFTALLAFAFTANAQQTIPGFSVPESVLLNGKDIFVSNVGARLDPLAKDADGFISKLSSKGKLIKQKFQQGTLNAPKGLAVAHEVLYVADIDRVVGFDIRDGKQLFELPVSGAVLLNDLCNIDDTTLAVSDSFTDHVYLVHLVSKTYTLVAHIPGPNGLAYKSSTKQLFVCTLGEQMNAKGKLFVKDLDVQDTVAHELTNSPTGFFDGLELMNEDELLFSDWVSGDAKAGKLWIYNLKNNSVESIPFVVSPADIYFDKASHKVFTPVMTMNEVYIADLTALRSKDRS